MSVVRPVRAGETSPDPWVFPQAYDRSNGEPSQAESDPFFHALAGARAECVVPDLILWARLR